MCFFKPLTLLTASPGLPAIRLNNVAPFSMGLQHNSGLSGPASTLAEQGPAQTTSRAMPMPCSGPSGHGSLCPSCSYHRGPAGDEFDGVLHLLLGHLHYTTVLLLGGKGLLPLLGHPGVQLQSQEGREESGPQADRHPVSKGPWALHQQWP